MRSTRWRSAYQAALPTNTRCEASCRSQQPPYEQFTEARSGQGTFTFLTGEGGFLQAFLYGWAGFRWREDRIHLDPALPDQWAEHGLTLREVSYRGRVFSVSIRDTETRSRSTRDPPSPLRAPSRPRHSRRARP